MRFSIEQNFLTDSSGRPLAARATAHHVIEAETVDAALSSFLSEQRASLVGDVQRFPGAQAIAIAQQRGTIFTAHVEPGTNAFRKHPRASMNRRQSETNTDRDRAE